MSFWLYPVSPPSRKDEENLWYREYNDLCKPKDLPVIAQRENTALLDEDNTVSSYGSTELCGSRFTS